MPVFYSEASESLMPLLWQLLPLFAWLAIRLIEKIIPIKKEGIANLYGIILGIGSLVCVAFISIQQPLGYFKVGDSGLSYLINENSKLMMLLIYFVGGVVMLFSGFYFKQYPKPKIRLIFAGLSFFICAMLGIASAGNLFQMFVFWEFVGLCSYLLISFENEKFSAGKASLAVMLINRLGDLVFLVLVAVLYVSLESTEIIEIAKLMNLVDLQHNKVHTGMLWLGGALTLIAFSKSAQIPFSAWLIEAMEGPTPVSALMHAATMVTAGVFLLIQLHIFLIPEVQIIILIGSLSTAALAGLSIYGEKNFKKMLGYSTIAQLGFMMAGLIASDGKIALSHLLAHAPYKAGLFLMAAILIKLSDAKIGKSSISSVRYANILSTPWPWRINALMFTLSLAGLGLPIFYGFYTKEAIYTAIETNVLLYAPALSPIIKVLYYLATLGSMVFYLQMSIVFGKKLLKPTIDNTIILKYEYKAMLALVALLVLSSFVWQGFLYESLLFSNYSSLEKAYLDWDSIIHFLTYLALSIPLLYLLPFYRNLGFGGKLRLHYILKHYVYERVVFAFYRMAVFLSDRSPEEGSTNKSLVNGVAKSAVVFAHFISTLDKLLVDGIIVRLNAFINLSISKWMLSTLGAGRVQVWIGAAFSVFVFLAICLFW